MSNAAVFMYKPEAIKHDSRLPGRDQLFSLLEQRDIQPFISLGAEAAFADGAIVGTTLTHEGPKVLEAISHESAGIYINRLDRSLKKDEIQTEAGTEWSPMINENEMRSLVWRKERVAKEIFDEGDMGIQTDLFETEADVQKHLDENDNASFFVKSRHGNLGKGMLVVPRDELLALFKDDPSLYKKRVVQPVYEFTSFPKTLRPFDAASRENFEAQTNSGAPGELRVYSFLSPEAIRLFPIGRTLNEGDNWFFVDPDSVDQSVMAMSALATKKAAVITGSKAVLTATDYGYGTLNDSEPSWKAIEMNGLAPYIVGYDKHETVAHIVHTMLADQIRETIGLE